jgi:hypothetical protein
VILVENPNKALGTNDRPGALSVYNYYNREVKEGG